MGHCPIQRDSMMKKNPNPPHVEVVKKTVTILKAFSKENYTIGVREMAEKTKMPKSTVQRLLSTLEAEGMVYKDPISQKYGLGTEILALAGIVLSHMNFRQTALPFMMDLSKKWQETVDLDILDGTDVIVVEQIPGKYALSVGSSLIRRLPAYCTSTGKVLLASAGTEYVRKNLPPKMISNLKDQNLVITRDQLIRELENVKNQGFARSKEEREKFVYAIGVPITDINDKIIAALSVSGFVSRIEENEEKIIHDLKEAATSISKQLLHNPY